MCEMFSLTSRYKHKNNQINVKEIKDMKANLLRFEISTPLVTPAFVIPTSTWNSESINNTSLMMPSSGRMYARNVSLTISHLVIDKQQQDSTGY